MGAPATRTRRGRGDEDEDTTLGLGNNLFFAPTVLIDVGKGIGSTSSL